MATSASKKPTPAAPVNNDILDIDDLLGVTADDEAGPEIPETPAEPAVVPETADQKRIRQLEEQLRAPEPVITYEAPEAELTPDQKRIKELEAMLAERQAHSVAPSADELEFAPAEQGETILIHFVDDGFIAQGTTWYRGQELEFVIGSEAHRQTFDKNGVSWLDLRDDFTAQSDKYGREMFRSGPWRGKQWNEIDSPEYQRAAELEQKRNRAAPLMR